MLDLYEGRELGIHEIDINVEPYVGMEFESEEAAMMYYDAYAKRLGFIIRVGNCHRSGREGSVISQRFLCNKEGFRVNNNKTRNTRSLEVRKPRQITREGCTDEKEKKIRELSTELSRANQQIAQCQEQLKIILKYIEHANHLTKSVQKIVENVKEIEAEGQE
ncbi:hypothetical protein ACB092_12G202300 [Castanea dentata]